VSAVARDLSPSQHGIWLADKIAGAHSPFILSRCWAVPGPVSVTALRLAVGDVIGWHDALRTAVEEHDGQPRQRVASRVACDLRLWEGPQDISAFFAEPFDLRTPPGLRVGTGPGDAGEHLVGLRAHHLLCDGPALAIIRGDLAVAYSARHAGQVPPPPGPRLGYWRYLDLLARQLALPSLRDALDYWRRVLLPQPPPAGIPGDLPRPAWPSYRGRTVPLPLAAGLAGRVDASARQLGVPPSAIALAVAAILIARRCGQLDVCVGTPVSGSELLAGQDCPGLTANLVPVRMRLEGAHVAADVMRVARDALADALDAAWVPLEILLARLPLSRQPGLHPLFQVNVSYADERGSAPFALGDLPARPQPVPDSRGARADLTFELVRDHDGYRGQLEFATDVYQQASGERIARDYAALLAAVVADPRAAVIPPPPDGTARGPAPDGASPEAAGPETAGPETRVITGPPAAAGQLTVLIADVWRQVLERPVLDLDRTFFDYGGTSLLLTRVHAQLAARGVTVSILELFRRPTVRLLATSLGDGDASTG
jgi:hypothetical protein